MRFRASKFGYDIGVEQIHAISPGAASLDIGETATVDYTFARAGALEFACHLPGHYAYGMRGTVTVA